jgi:hypothetical protein
VKGSQILGAEIDKFYELLAGSSRSYTLYKLIKSRFIKVNKQDLERIKNGDFDDEYRDESFYYITSPHESLKPIKLSIKSIRASLQADDAKKIKVYIDQFYQNEVNEIFIKRLIDYLNRND